jgi:hypothetical protein
MRHPRWAVPAAVTLALCSSSSAAAGGAPVVTPSSGHELAEWFKTVLELPTPVNPVGAGDPCARLGPNGKLLIAVSFPDAPANCTAEFGTIVNTGTDHFCSTFSFDRDSKFYAEDKRDQRECARRVSTETAVLVSVDGAPGVDLTQPQFSAYTPQLTIRLPADNIFGINPETATITGFGWHASIHGLSVGRHHFTTMVQKDEEWSVYQHEINIVPRRHPHERD